MTDEPLMTSGQVCAELDIDRSTMIRRIAAGKLRYVQKLPGPNGGYLFDPAEIKRHAAEPQSVAS